MGISDVSMRMCPGLTEGLNFKLDQAVRFALAYAYLTKNTILQNETGQS